MFRNELEDLINSHSMENGSNTPDGILAQYLIDSLASFDKATKNRDSWYGVDLGPGYFLAKPPTGEE